MKLAEAMAIRTSALGQNDADSHNKDHEQQSDAVGAPHGGAVRNQCNRADQLRQGQEQTNGPRKEFRQSEVDQRFAGSLVVEKLGNPGDAENGGEQKTNCPIAICS